MLPLLFRGLNRKVVNAIIAGACAWLAIGYALLVFSKTV